ncbi:MAG: zinc ribbon domain-containing protein [Elusimicrobia bacterium]|nr:zinc ribbon domain-containing protein [Elusimicrobiota bacterium]
MPLFEFICNDCSKKFEHLVLSSNTDSVSCPVCKSAKVTKQFSTFSAKSSGTSSSVKEMPSVCPSSRGMGCGGCGK